MTQEADSAAAAANLAAVQTASLQGERLAIVETQVTDIKADVAEIKVDVKSLLASQAGFQGGASLMGRAAPWLSLLISLAVAVFVIAGASPA